MLGNSAAQLAVGLEGWKQTCRVVARGGDRAVGFVGMFDIGNSDAAVTSNQSGVANSGLSSIVAPVDTGTELKFGMFCVLTEAISDDQQGNALYKGRVKALVKKASGNISAGDPLTVATDGSLTADVVSGDKVVAIALEGKAGPSTAVLADVLFDGIHGCGAA
ncbi:MAG: hypothetical protein ACX94C_07715 [Phycisphaerales bacterium]